MYNAHKMAASAHVVNNNIDENLCAPSGRGKTDPRPAGVVKGMKWRMGSFRIWENNRFHNGYCKCSIMIINGGLHVAAYEFFPQCPECSKGSKLFPVLF